MYNEKNMIVSEHGEKLKDPGKMLLRYAYPLILYVYPYIPPRCQRKTTSCFQSDVFRPYLDHPSFRHSLIRIEHQILDDLTHLFLIHLHRPEIIREGKRATDIGPS